MPKITTNIKEVWNEASRGFFERWQIPNCIGSIDGKHVTIKCPPKSGSNYYCYLKKFSIVLLAIVGPDYKFISVNIGSYGKNSDGGIFEESNMGIKFANCRINVPPPKYLPGQIISTPHVLIGEEAFALKPYLMRPFPRRLTRHDENKENYNYRLCRSRRIVKNASGILTKKWRLFDRSLETNVETSKLIVNATCILHNFLITKKSNSDDLLVSPNISCLNNLNNNVARSRNVAFEVREQFVTFFNNNRF